MRLTTDRILGCLGLIGGLIIALILPGGPNAVIGLLGTAGAIGLGIGIQIINDVLMPQDYYKFMENIDDDEAWETIIRYRDSKGNVKIEIVDDDGTIYTIFFDSEGNEIKRLKKVPDPDNQGEYLVYIWDYETKSYNLEEENIEEPGGAGEGGGGNKVL